MKPMARKWSLGFSPNVLGTLHKRNRDSRLKSRGFRSKQVPNLQLTDNKMTSVI